MSQIHPTVVIKGDVKIGPGSVVEAFCYLRGPIVIGANTRIYPHCVIGTEAEHKSRPSVGVIKIGDNTTIRELTVIQRGTGDRDTEIQNDCYIMDHCHVAHDVVIEDGATLSPNVVLGGHTRVHRGATVGIAAITHQFSTIGAYTMIGMGSIVTKDVPPFGLVSGNPARFRRFNTHAFAAAGLVEGDLRIEAGVIVSDHPNAQKLIEHFKADCRRAVLPLATSGD